MQSTSHSSQNRKGKASLWTSPKGSNRQGKSLDSANLKRRKNGESLSGLSKIGNKNRVPRVDSPLNTSKKSSIKPRQGGAKSEGAWARKIAAADNAVYENSELLSFGQRLKLIRFITGAGKYCFGGKIGFDQRALRKVEEDNSEIPSPLLIDRVCEVAGVNREWLLTGKGPMSSEKTPGETVSESLRSEADETAQIEANKVEIMRELETA